MKLFKLASFGGIQFSKTPPANLDQATQVMDNSGNPVAYMDMKVDVKAKDSVRTALLEMNSDGTLVINCVQDMWVKVAFPEFDGSHHTRHQVHGLFEVSQQESLHIKGPTIQAESADDVETVLAAFGER